MAVDRGGMEGPYGGMGKRGVDWDEGEHLRQAHWAEDRLTQRTVSGRQCEGVGQGSRKGGGGC